MVTNKMHTLEYWGAEKLEFIEQLFDNETKSHLSEFVLQ